MAAENEIERLVVRLGLDGKPYKRGLREAEAATARYTRGIDGKLRDARGKFVRDHRAMIASTNKLVSAMGRAGAAAGVYGAKLMSAGRSVSAFGRSMLLRVTAPLAIIGGLAARSFAKFNQAMTESTSIMKVTGDQTERMTKLALKLSRQAPQGPEELAKSYFFLASAGKNAEQAMALMPTVMKFATAGAFDMALATDLLTDAQSALGISSKNVQEDMRNMVLLSDVLVKANTLANATVQQFAESLTADAATASRTVNAELETTVAILALYADKGKKAAESGNLFGRAIRLLTKAARDNAKDFEKLNVKAIDETTGEYRNFIDILDDMNKAFAGMTKPQIGKALADLGFRALAQKAILPLLGATEQLKKYEAQLKEAGGTTEDVANKQLKSFSNQMKIVWNNVKVMAISIGEILAPMIQKLGNQIKLVTIWWARFDKGTKRAIIVIGVVAALIAPALMALGASLSVLGMSLIAFKFAVAGLGIVIGILTSPIFLVTAAIVAFGTLLLFYTEAGGVAIDWIKEKWASFADSIAPGIKGITDAIKAGEFQLAWEVAWAQMELTFFQAIEPIQIAWIAFVGGMKSVWVNAMATIETTWSHLREVLAKGMLAAQQVGADEGTKKFLDAAMTVSGIVGSAERRAIKAQRTKDLIETAVETIKKAVEVENRILDLKKQRDVKADEAAKRLREKRLDEVLEEFKNVVVDVKVPDAPEIPQPDPITVPVRFVLLDASIAGSAEALARLEHQIRATAQPGGGGGAAPVPQRPAVMMPEGKHAVPLPPLISAEEMSEMVAATIRTAEASEALLASDNGIL